MKTETLKGGPSFGARRITYTKEGVENLSKWKTKNNGSVYSTVLAAIDSGDYKDMDLLDLVYFSERCDAIIASWDKPSDHRFEVVTPS